MLLSFLPHPFGCFVFFKAVFQGDGLEIVRLNLSVGGWELPSGRNAKGCLEAVKNTAGECPIKRAKKGGAFSRRCVYCAHSYVDAV